jgi:membrane protein implicated in regulation of membrane protease activity
MMHFNWDAIYLTCFGVGLVMSFLSFLGGFGHLHIGHVRLHAGHRGAATHGGTAIQGGAKGVAHTSPLNGFTMMAFLCWFGGTGYLLHRGGVLPGAVVLVLAALSGLAGASLVFWFLSRVLLANEKTLEPADTEMIGVVGRLSGAIRRGGVGEMLYSQNGARWSAAVRSDDGEAIERGAEVIVMRRARGVAYVRRWDEFAHGLLAEPVRREEQ